MLAPLGDALDVLGHLADGRAHAALAHAVRAAEVQLDAVGAGVLDLRQHVAARPLSSTGTISETTIARSGQSRLTRRISSRLVCSGRSLISSMLLKPITRRSLRQQRRVARAVDVDDRRVLAERLPDHAAPAGLEGAHDVVLLVGRRRRREPERVRAPDADERRAQVSHGSSPCSVARGGGASAAQREVDRHRRALAVLDGLDGQVAPAEAAIATGPDARVAACGRRRRSRCAPPCRSTADPAGVGDIGLADRLEHHVGGERELLAGLDQPAALERGGGEAHAAQLAALAEQLLRRRPVADRHAVGLRPALLDDRRRHRLRPAAVDDRHLLGAEQARLHRRVDRRHAAADDEHAPADRHRGRVRTGAARR